MNRLLNTSSSSSSEDQEIFVRRKKIYNTRVDYLAKHDDLDFFQRFRLSKDTVIYLLGEIEDQIKLPTNRGGCIQPMSQLLLTLRFYASGNMQIAVADFMGVSRSSACRIIQRVSCAIASLSVQYIKMYETNEEMEKAVAEFYVMYSFPRVIGAIDGTLIRIDSPGGNDAEIYRCRKDFFAINVQSVCDARMRFINIVARWPGSTHDQTIFNNSDLKQDFENGRYARFLLIGDSGYSLQSYLMTKLQETRTPAEVLYNESLIRTRNVVERSYGVWKRRFPILRFGMRLKLDTVRTIIIATAVLHNIAISTNEHIPPEWLEDNGENAEDIQNEENVDNNHIAGRNVRQLIITEHFAAL